MKTGLTIQELAAEIQGIEDSKKDFVAPTSKLWAKYEGTPGLDPDPSDFQIQVEGNGSYEICNVAHNQIAQRLGIPTRYYRRMQEEIPELLTTNINAWFRQNPEQRMVRTIDNRMRAFLSDKYRPLDNMLVAKAALPIMAEQSQAGNLIVKSSEITERRMYIQCAFPKIEAEVKVGDIVQAGIAISNSEVGLGSFNVEMLIFRLICSNGMVRENSMKKYHVGKRIDTGDEVTHDFYSEETRKADDEAFMMKVKDTLKHSFNPSGFQTEVLKLRQSTERDIPVKAVESSIQEVTKKFNLSDTEGEGILGHLIKGGDLTQWGMANAITTMAHNQDDYDRAFDYERIGGKVIDLSDNEWSVIAKAV